MDTYMDQKPLPAEMRLAEAFEGGSAVARGRGLTLKAFSYSGGLVHSNHRGDKDGGHNERHHLNSFTLTTEEYGTWSFFHVNRNSLGNESMGIVKSWTPLSFGVLGVSVDGSLSLGAATGYNVAVLPIVTASLRLGLYETKAFGGNLNFGLAVSAAPYTFDKGNEEEKKKSYGFVTTSPYLSIRWTPNETYKISALNPVEIKFNEPLFKETKSVVFREEARPLAKPKGVDTSLLAAYRR